MGHKYLGVAGRGNQSEMVRIRAQEGAHSPTLRQEKGQDPEPPDISFQKAQL